MRYLCTDDVDFPSPLHYVDVLNKRNEFNKLRDSTFRTEFNERYMHIVSGQEYTICCVVLDKQEHFRKYERAALHPYHHCFSIMLERYVMFLNKNNGVGDIVVETRGKREDKKMKKIYETMYTNGTQSVRQSEIETYIQSNTIKFCQKKDFVCGIEFADMLATPMKYYVLSQYEQHTLSDNFSKQVLETLHAHRKNMASPGDDSAVRGYGLKLLP